MRFAGLFKIILAAQLLIIGAFLFLNFYSISQAQGVKIVTNVLYTQPEVESLFVSNSEYKMENDFQEGINLNAGGTEVNFNGQIQHDSGSQTVYSVYMKFFRNGVGENCSASDTNCYIISSCDFKTTTASSLYNCLVNLKPWAEATDSISPYANESWHVVLYLLDKNGDLIKKESNTLEVRSLLMLDVTTEIDYGKLKKGEETTKDNNQEMLLKQMGNTKATVLVSGDNMVCDDYIKLPIENQKWSTQDVGFDDDKSYSLTNQVVSTSTYVGYNGANYQAQDTLYWNLKAPLIGGIKCRGNITLEYKIYESSD